MRALVTGGGGFLGRAIVEQLLATGVQVRTLARSDYPQLERAGAECLRGDIRDRASVERACAEVDVVHHTAALAGIWGPWKDYYDINVRGTQNVIAACRARGVGKLVFTSSPSVTFDGVAQENVDESAPYATRWLCHYAHTKALAEHAVLAANGPELATCALRPHLIWGPNDPHLIPRLIERARQGALRRVGDGTNRIDMVYVDNAARAQLLAADSLGPDSPVAGKAYFISQGEPVNCWSWINEILKLAGLPPLERSISVPAAWMAGAVLEGIYGLLRLPGEPRMTRFLASQLGTSHYFNIGAARRDLHYTPQVSTTEGMRRLAEWLESR
jgi:nucleoside-diphosphate-sugar epimerase